MIIATDRAKRPSDFTRQRVEISGHRFCPFCAGNELRTPPEILAYRTRGGANEPGWTLRVISNKFPVLRVEGAISSKAEGIYDKMNGIGAHEVIVECPHHESTMAGLSEENVREVLWVYRDRLVDLKKDPRLVYGMVFKNVGAAAGASLEHTHSQLIVTSVVPITVWEEMTGALEFYNYRGRCIYEDMIRQELKDGSRVVHDTPEFLVFCPYAARFPFETWIVPKRHGSHYETIQRHQVDDLGGVLKTTLAKLELALDDPPYNYVLHTAPFDTPDLPHYRWHFELFPRLTRVAGFEWGSGFYINPVAPEEAAAFLREVEIPTDYGKEHKASA